MSNGLLFDDDVDDRGYFLELHDLNSSYKPGGYAFDYYGGKRGGKQGSNGGNMSWAGMGADWAGARSDHTNITPQIIFAVFSERGQDEAVMTTIMQEAHDYLVSIR